MFTGGDAEPKFFSFAMRCPPREDREGFSKFSQVVNEANAIMNPDMFQLLLAHKKIVMLSESAWETANDANGAQRLELLASLRAGSDPAFTLRRQALGREATVEVLNRDDVAVALRAGKPWLQRIVELKQQVARVLEADEEKSERIYLESISFGAATLSITHERVLDQGTEREDYRLVLRTPKGRPKQRDYPLAVDDVASAVARGEPILLLALQIHDEARLALLSEDAGIFSAAEAAAIEGAAAFRPTKRGAPSL